MSQAQVVTPRGGRRMGFFADSGEGLRRLQRTYGPAHKHWLYEDAAGGLVAHLLWWETNRGPVQRTLSRCPGGGWALASMPRPWPLYTLPAMLTYPDRRVYVLASEEAAEAALNQGLLATTCAQGRAGVGKTDWQPLASRDVVLLPGNSWAQRWYAQMVAAVLATLQPPARVRTLELPGLPPGGDIRDWIKVLGPDIQPADVQARMESLVAATPPVTLAPCPDRPILRCLAEVAPAPVCWLWPGRVPRGRLTLLVGRPGEGKSFLATDLAARVSTGRSWPDGTACEAGSVLFICAEDDAADTLRPRLDAHGADVERIHLLSMVSGPGSDGRAGGQTFTLAHVGALEEGLRSCPDCRLVVVDPIGSFLGRGTDAYRESDVRALLDPVARLAEAYGPAVLLIAHQRKSPNSRYADDLALGSRAFTGVARAVWHVTHDPQDQSRRLLLPGKNNLAAPAGLAFRIAGDPPAIQWEDGAVDLTADKALAAETRAPGGRRAAIRSQAVEWLRALLAEGPVGAQEVHDAAADAGYSKRNVECAQHELGIHPVRVTGTGPWIWRLPGPSPAPGPAPAPNPQAEPHRPPGAVLQKR
jgi:putative DNA primase/helicase